MREDTYNEEINIDSDLHGDMVVLELLYPIRMCVFDVCIDIYAASCDGRHPYKILSQYERRKKVKYIEAFLEGQFQFMRLVLSV